MVSKEEESIFRAFLETLPDFAGRELRCEPGADPPDFLGTDPTGRRVGIELGEWLNPQQMAASVAQERQEARFLAVLKSEEEEPPQNVGFVVMRGMAGATLQVEDAHRFREEAYRCAQEMDFRWSVGDGWEGPRRIWASELAAYPCLSKYIASLTVFPRRGMPRVPGVAWLTFEGRGGAYTHQWAVDTLLGLLSKKTSMYGNLHGEQALNELYLIAYYDRALIHNTPFVGVNFGWEQVVRIAGEEIAKNPGPFQKVFLFHAIPQDRTVTLLWG